ncbi:hypothetical protein [Winogradskyella sp.]|uniref:hypothetical protein n=1 Tax=Winogradskyella sp. TaxID=1883156 RepID=UPI001B01A640|nr:hypothetical protein [Winogradskyella sp.]MBO6881258.1 hypothetical protein [Winogradskyella sp.]
MIKFFRRIRQNLLNKNKVGKYLLYAIGEVLLVVIGILIALQLNNQNEFRKQKLVEIKILDGIRSDILKDTIDLNDNIRGYKIFVENDSIMLNHFANKKEQTNNIINYLNYSIKFDLLIGLHDAHFQEAKLKGLAIISNDSLKILINRLYEFHYKVLIAVENNYENFNTAKLLRHEIGQYFGYDSTGIVMSKDSYNKMLSNSNSLYHLANGREFKKTLLQISEQTLESALIVEKYIKNEIASLKEK